MQSVTITQITPPELQTLIEETLRKIFAESTSTSKKEDDILTIEQASTYLNLAKATIYSMTCRREIPFMKKENGKKLYFSKEALEAWLKTSSKKVNN